MSSKSNIILFEKVDYNFQKNGFIKPTNSNPQYWGKIVRTTFTHVYAPNHPHIESAYEAVGIKVWRPEATQVESTPVAEEVLAEVPVETTPEVVKEDWRDKPAADLKDIAQAYTSDEVKTKKQAIEVLEANNYKG